MFKVLLFVGKIFEFAGDMNLVLKILVLITIISYVRQHLGNGIVSIIAILGLAWFVIFNGWQIFGGIYVLYAMLLFGVAQIMIDFFFVGGGEQPVSSGADLAVRAQSLQAARGNFATRFMRRGG